MSLNLHTYRAQVADLSPGDTMRVNHEDCSAGEDIRRRLYLTRVMADPTKVIGYCHNCAQGGVLTEGTYEQYRDDRHSKQQAYDVTVSTVALPDNQINLLKEWPTYAQAWAISNKLYQHDLDKFQITYDPSSDRVCLPRWETVCTSHQTMGELQGYQLRQLRGTGSKYTTTTLKEAPGYTVIRTDNRKTDWCIIVEDLISGIAIARADPRQHVIVNYGVKINPLVINFAKAYLKPAVWLDNDSVFVKSQAKTYADTIALYGGQDVYVYQQEHDPKEFSESELFQELETRWIT